MRVQCRNQAATPIHHYPPDPTSAWDRSEEPQNRTPNGGRRIDGRKPSYWRVFATLSLVIFISNGFASKALAGDASANAVHVSSKSVSSKYSRSESKPKSKTKAPAKRRASGNKKDKVQLSLSSDQSKAQAKAKPTSTQTSQNKGSTSVSTPAKAGVSVATDASAKSAQKPKVIGHGSTSGKTAKASANSSKKKGTQPPSASKSESSQSPGILAKASAPMAFGLAAHRSISGARGIQNTLFISDKWNASLLFGFATFGHRETNNKGEFKKLRLVGRISTGIGATHWLVNPKNSSLGKLPLRVDVGMGARLMLYWGFIGDDGDDDKTLDRPLELDLEIPISIRLWLGRRVYFTPEFGLVMRYIPGSRKPDQNNDTDANPGSGVGERLGTTNGPGFGIEWGDHAGMFVGLALGYRFDPKLGKK